MSTYDGLSIAWAVVEYIHNAPQLRSRTLFATHYHELTRLAETLPNLKNYNVAVSEHNGDVVFLHKIIPGAADRSYGIHVGRIAGLPKPIKHEVEQDEGDDGDRDEAREDRGPPRAPHQDCPFCRLPTTWFQLRGSDQSSSPSSSTAGAADWADWPDQAD